MPVFRLLCLLGCLVSVTFAAQAQILRLPTGNRALLEPGKEPAYFVGTVGKTWTSGTFGCVRTDGWQMHEGIDIKAISFDRQGEATDSVNAAADGAVAYISRKPGLSNYGNYIVLRHRVEGIEFYTLYAHLASVSSSLQAGSTVKAGESLGVLGRTSNTRQRISKDRAHLHFEIDLLVNEKFPQWFARHAPGQRNDHGLWNGQNLLGLDPRWFFLAQAQHGSKFSLAQFLKSQTTLCRVVVRDPSFPWARRFPMLVQPTPQSQRSGVAGYEVHLNFNGVPFRLIPRTREEIAGGQRVQLLQVEEAEYQRNPCRKLVVKKGAGWQLTQRGIDLFELLSY